MGYCTVGTRILARVAVAVALLVWGPNLFGQFGGGPSFGNIFNRKTIDLTRKLPPVWDVHGKAVSVIMAPDNEAGRTNVEIQSEIEKLLTSGDSTVRAEVSAPDITINCQITNYSAPAIETEREGTTTTDYVQGGLNVAFRILEARTGHIIASSVATSQVIRQIGSSSLIHNPFQKERGDKNVSTKFDAQNSMVDDVARQIAAYLVITPEHVTVTLAQGGPLGSSDNLAKNLLWSRVLEELGTLTPAPDPRVDSYRIYNMGVANEALAYQTQDKKAALKFLQDASIDYGKATAARPDEKNYLPAQNRIAVALEHYAEHKQADAAPTGEAGPGASDVITNDDVIKMTVAHVDSATIIETIQGASKVKFEFGVNAVIRLTNNGVSKEVIASMRQKAKTAAGK
jgi:hypothetical protein